MDYNSAWKARYCFASPRRASHLFDASTSSTCKDLWPEADASEFRSKGGLSWCKGKKMIGVQIRTFFESNKPDDGRRLHDQGH